jgi:DNA-3-methyladenine glycosylase I
MTSYCAYLRLHPEDELNRRYHDREYGFPLADDAALLPRRRRAGGMAHGRREAALLERLALEINQAGLSWTLMLKRQQNFRGAFEGFDVDRVAAYGESDVARLLADAGIIRNRMKVNAVIENARRITALRAEYGSFQGWLDRHHPLPLEEWVRLFKKTFVFTGGEIVKEFLLSTGYLPGAHDTDCPVYAQIARLGPAWMRSPQ